MAEQRSKLSLYNDLQAAYLKSKKHMMSREDIQKECNQIWSEIKCNDLIQLTTSVLDKIDSVKKEAKDRRMGAMAKWPRIFTKKKAKLTEPSHQEEATSSTAGASNAEETPAEPPSAEPTEEQPSGSQVPSESQPEQDAKKLTPTQDKLNADIQVEKDILIGLYRKRDNGMMTADEKKELEKREKNLDKMKKDLQRAEANRIRQK